MKDNNNLFKQVPNAYWINNPLSFFSGSLERNNSQKAKLWLGGLAFNCQDNIKQKIYI